MRTVSLLLTLLLLLPMTGWMILSVAGDGAQAGCGATTCAISCSMSGMEGMACPMMAQARRDQACACHVSGVPRAIVTGPIRAIAPEPGSDFVTRLYLLATLPSQISQDPQSGFPGAIDHPPSSNC